MRKLLRLFLLDLRLLTKNKTFYLKLILFPSILILILGTVFSDSSSQIKSFNVAFYNADKGSSEGVATILDRFNASVRTMNVEQRTILQTISSKDSVPKDKIEKVMSLISGNKQLSLKIPEVPTNTAAVPIDAMQYYSIAMVVMFSIMTAFVLVHSIVDEKQNHTLFRIKSTPTLNIQYVLGKLFGIILSVVIQMTVVIIISRVVFQMKWGNPLELLVITIVYAFAIGSIILLWGFIAKDHVTVSSLASPVLYIFSFLGGSFITKSGLPDSLRVIQEIIPNGKAINSYLKVCQGVGLDGMYIDLLELIGIGLIFIIFNIMVYSGKRWNKSAIYSHGKKPAEADVSK